MFPALARAALADILGRYRRVWRRRHRQPMRVLHWSQPGRVWAIDFHGPRPPIDGLYPHLLAVRDLASGQQLAWLPVRDLHCTIVSRSNRERLEREVGEAITWQSPARWQVPCDEHHQVPAGHARRRTPAPQIC
jgi:hypothetical protein